MFGRIQFSVLSVAAPLFLIWMICSVSMGATGACQVDSKDGSKAANGAAAVKSIYDLAVKSVDGKDVKLSSYKGKVALFVNTASKCGYTGQYKDLQNTFDKFKDKGFVVLGFPSNDFGGQEPGSNKDIKDFCETNFNVKFPLFEKGPVTGQAIQPVYKHLTAQSDAKLQGDVAWNFEKFLVDKNGVVVARYKSGVSPSSTEITKAIEENLKKEATACM